MCSRQSGQLNAMKGKRGRKGASQSRAGEIRAKLLTWRQAPEPQRISLRGLAAEIGTSHQLLSFHLRRLDRWQGEENYREAREICARAEAERRPMTQEEEARSAACRKVGLYFLIEGTLRETSGELRKQAKRGKLSRSQIRIVRLLAGKGYREAQEILNVHHQHDNNLPLTNAGAAKSFKRAKERLATPLK